jgi:hypothetical protein
MSCDCEPFRFESEMFNPLMSVIPTVFNVESGQRTRVVCRPAIGPVIPDLLLGIWTGDLPRWGGLNSVSRHILTWLSVQKVAANSEQLRNDLFLSQDATAFGLSTLRRAGAIAMKDSGEVVLQSAFDVMASIRLIAMEIKLSRWREALEQAVTYRKFADKAYVVLDGNQVRLSDRVTSEFAAHGIDLLIQRGASLQTCVDAMPIAPTPSADRLFAVGELASGPYCLA